jgi:hypothetical protein
VKQQLNNMFHGLNLQNAADFPFKYVVNVDKLRKQEILRKVKEQEAKNNFSINDIKL